MTTSDDGAFADLVSRASADHRIAALVLGGGRGKGQATAHSDYDVYLILADGITKDLSEYAMQDSNLEVFQIPRAGFETYADFDSDEEWNRYNFAHLTAVIDKTRGDVQRRVDQMEVMPLTVAASRAADSLDSFVNSTYRAAKSARSGDTLAAQLDSLEAWPSLLDFIFSTECRVRPYNKFLGWELASHPLESPLWDQVSLLTLMSRAGVWGDLDALGEAFLRVEQSAKDHNLSQVLTAWSTEALGAIRDLHMS
ncbi:MAG: hypothetical protein ABI586_02770 [Candidatus Nanopelagicales bacterium]